MTASSAAPLRSGSSPEVHGRRLGIASLLMVPSLAISYVVAYFVGSGLQAALDLAEDEMLWDAGALGVLAAVLVTGLLASPSVAGIVLGVGARRLGERRLGTAGAIVNGAIGAYLALATVAGLVAA